MIRPVAQALRLLAVSTLFAGCVVAEDDPDGPDYPWLAGGSSNTGTEPDYEYVHDTGPVRLQGAERPNPGCEVEAPEPFLELPRIAPLPDPFTHSSGNAVRSTSDWACRRADIIAALEVHELGEKPPPPSSVVGHVDNDSLTIEVEHEERAISFSVQINRPSGEGPFPAMIAYGFPSIPLPDNVATIVFNNDEIAEQKDRSSRGKGKFYDLYSSSHPAGALMAWAWGVSRIIDVLQQDESLGIDATRVGVTGCSRNGKGALVAGAMDARIALTIPQESGSGGSACWRVSDEQSRNGDDVQTASQIWTENVWFRSTFSQIGASVANSNVEHLSTDHHLLLGLVAPRGLLVIENTSMEWLGDESTFTCSMAGRRVYDALAASDHMGYSQMGGHDHCSFPPSQEPELNAYIEKFLLEQETDTEVVRTDGDFTLNEELWIDWDTPELTQDLD